MLLDFPVEIRLLIYTHIYRDQRLKAIPPRDDTYPSDSPQSYLLNILVTNKQVFREALPIFYTHTTFVFPAYGPRSEQTVWPQLVVASSFPSEVKLSDDQTVNSSELVRYVHYAGNDRLFINHPDAVFPALRILEIDLGWDHVGNDQTNFDRAMKYVVRHKEWRNVVVDALLTRFGGRRSWYAMEMWSAVLALKGFYDSDDRTAIWRASAVSRAVDRKFGVVFIWSLGYRFVEFVSTRRRRLFESVADVLQKGICDLDEWVLRVRDPDGNSKNVYEIRQDELALRPTLRILGSRAEELESLSML